MKRIITISALILSGGAASAQTVSSGAAIQPMKIDVTNAIEITFTDNSSAVGNNIALPFNTVVDYANGVESKPQELVVVSNTAFSLAVKTDAENFTYMGTTTRVLPVMPVKGVLALKISSNNTGGTISAPFSTTSYNSLTGTNQNLLTATSKGSNQAFSLSYKATPGFEYPGGVYSVGVVYTASQQ